MVCMWLLLTSAFLVELGHMQHWARLKGNFKKKKKKKRERPPYPSSRTILSFIFCLHVLLDRTAGRYDLYDLRIYTYCTNELHMYNQQLLSKNETWSSIEKNINTVL